MSRRVVLITGAGFYACPALAERLARSEHDLALCGSAPGQLEVLESLGSRVLAIEESPGPGAVPRDRTAQGWGEIVERVRAHFGRLDAAALVPRPLRPEASGFTRGPFLEASIDVLRDMTSYLDTTLFALQAILPAIQKPGGQILVLTSDAGARPEAGWALYGAARAGQNFLVRAVALEHAHEGVCINALGSKNAVYPGFPGVPADAVEDGRVIPGAWSAALEAETPLGRLGTMEELAAFAATLLDGTNRFQTAHYFSFSGGWHAL